jgi:hypothetical protein
MKAVRGLKVKECEGCNRGVLAGNQPDLDAENSRPLLKAGSGRLCCLQDLDDPIDDRCEGLVVETAGSIKNQVGTGRKEPVWPDVTWFVERSLRKIHVGDTDGVAIPDMLARDLAEDDVVPAGHRNDKSRPSFHG